MHTVGEILQAAKQRQSKVIAPPKGALEKEKDRLSTVRSRKDGSVVMWTLSPEAKARRRNTNAQARYPLLAHAGLLEQIGVKADWDARSVQDDDVARAIERDMQRVAKERQNRKQYAACVQMLDEVIGQDNREAVIAEYTERWRDHEPMQQWEYRLDYLTRYLAHYLGCAPLEVFEEAKRRCHLGGAA